MSRHRSAGRIAKALVALALSAAVLLFGAGSASANGHPPLPGDSGNGRRVVYSIGQQRVWWVESDNRVVNSYLVSGRAGTPAYGTYRVFSKSRYTTSLDGNARMEWMVRFAWGRSAAIGFHSIPVNRYGQPLQSEAQLGTPQSAGCVRQRWWDAAGLYDWAPIGTTVVVVK